MSNLLIFESAPLYFQCGVLRTSHLTIIAIFRSLRDAPLNDQGRTHSQVSVFSLDSGRLDQYLSLSSSVSITHQERMIQAWTRAEISEGQTRIQRHPT
ncbi:hypothetical protein PoB_007343400 [Plakobranchus ocellatus]|uniref:Uncharacterized protein n=1 Tax=Plakobranchus ocellatus TaxID=259542 RepID=A0AAV4DRT0_9GAST|nr:hypothetical protein PoB_007343400 [Plakobranchus ocellatus]